MFRLEEQRSVLTQLAATSKKNIATNHEMITNLEGLVEDLRKKVNQTNETGDKLIKELDSIKKKNEEQIYQNQLSYNSEENDRKHIVEALERLEDKANKIHGRVSVSDMWNTKVNQRCIQNPVKHVRWTFLRKPFFTKSSILHV